eukprot:scaffold106035_cov33-Phaeocystis_antarctica.AAC.1
MHLGGGRGGCGRLRLGFFLVGVKGTLCPLKPEDSLCHGSVVVGRRPLHTRAVHVVVRCVARGRSARPDPWLAHLPEAAVAQAVFPGLRKLELGRVFALDLDVLSAR